VGVAVVGCLVAVYLAARPVLREPVAALLRRVPPATGRGLGVLDVVVVVVAVLALAGIVTGDVEGPTALLAPVLLALAVGLLGAALLRRVAARAGRRALEHGRLANGIAALSLARRPSLRHVLVVVTTATALATFAANAVVVGAQNRTARAQLETGAPAVLETDATNPAKLAAAVDELPADERSLATPVVVIRPRDPSAVPTLLARPAELSRIGYFVPDHLEALTPPVSPSVQLADGVITGSLSWALTAFRTGDEPVGTAPNSPTGIPGGDLSVAPTPLQVGITVTTPDGTSLDRDLGKVEQSAQGTVPIRAQVLCPDGCRLAGLWLRGTDPWASNITGRLDLTDLTLDGAPLAIGGADNWLPVETPAADGTQEMSGEGNDLVIDFDNTGKRVLSRWGDVPDPMPVVLAGRPPADATGDDFTLVGLGGRPVDSRAVQHVDALPAVTDHGALADLDAQLRVGGEVSAGSTLQVWLGTEDPAVIRSVSAALAARGLPVTSTTTVSEAQEQYDRSATGWGLLLGVFTGFMALLVSCLVVGLVAVTSWRGVARDLAGLLVAGTPRAVLRSAVRREQLTTVFAGVLLGTLCGVVGTIVAMPLVPLFDRPAAVPVPDLAPAWLAIGATALGAALVVGGVGLLAARGVVARAVPERLRESL
jgi:putative ABC transport system permease protein